MMNSPRRNPYHLQINDRGAKMMSDGLFGTVFPVPDRG